MIVKKRTHGNINFSFPEKKVLLKHGDNEINAEDFALLKNHPEFIAMQQTSGVQVFQDLVPVEVESKQELKIEKRNTEVQEIEKVEEVENSDEELEDSLDDSVSKKQRGRKKREMSIDIDI